MRHDPLADLRAVVKRTGSDTPSITRAWSWSPGALGSNILMRPDDRQTGRTSRAVAALLPHYA